MKTRTLTLRPTNRPEEWWVHLTPWQRVALEILKAALVKRAKDE